LGKGKRGCSVLVVDERPTERDETRVIRVLVVDDDAAVGEALRRVLKAFDVVFTQSVSGALGRIQAGTRFDAIVCDYLMPGMTGIEFHGELEKTAPELARRLILVTGYSSNPAVQQFVQRKGIVCLGKPFHTGELCDAVRAVAADTAH
jgi:CheY-like chemotaxis protein